MHTERFYDPAPRLAIFIRRTGDGTHTGLFFRTRSGLFVQDMQWDMQFRSDRAHAFCPFVTPSLEPEELNDVSAMCRLIHDRQASSSPYRIPYAFGRGHNCRFHQTTGELMLGDGLGLTCATFVLTVFESVYVPLVDVTNWPQRDEDDARHRELLNRLRDGIPALGVPPADPQHVARVEAALPCIRVRPEEVAAAGLFNDLPATYQQLVPAGRWILNHLCAT